MAVVSRHSLPQLRPLLSAGSPVICLVTEDSRLAAAAPDIQAISLASLDLAAASELVDFLLTRSNDERMKASVADMRTRPFRLPIGLGGFLGACVTVIGVGLLMGVGDLHMPWLSASLTACLAFGWMPFLLRQDAPFEACLLATALAGVILAFFAFEIPGAPIISFRLPRSGFGWCIRTVRAPAILARAGNVAVGRCFWSRRP